MSESTNTAMPAEATPAPEEFILSDYRRQRETPSAPAAAAAPAAQPPDTTPAAEPKGDAEPSGDPGDPDEPQESNQQDKPVKGKGGFQQRISELTSEKHDLKRQNEELQRKLSELQKPAQPQPEAKPESKPEEDPEPDPDKFEDYGDYAKALSKWTVRQEVKAERAKFTEEQRKAQETAQQEQEANEINRRFRERVDAVKASRPDFEEVAFNSQFPMSQPMITAILDSEVGPEVMYYLGSHKAEAERISKLSPIATIRELGKIEAKLASSADPTPEPKKPIVSAAPEPVRPVSGGKAAPVALDPSKMSLDEWRRAREQGLIK